MKEIKYIILRDKKTGHLRHFKSDYLHHYTIARDNGYNSEDILEAGIFLDKHIYILECIILSHLNRRKEKFVFSSIYQDIRLNTWIKGRELESQVYYKRPAGILPEGD
jgi:hypothetical protein